MSDEFASHKIHTALPTGEITLELGEGPVWNPLKNELSLVDIFAGDVHLFRANHGNLEKTDGFHCEGDIGAALPTSTDEFVLCQNNGIFLRSQGGTSQKICDLPVAGRNLRCNDAKLGPDGNLWVGIMDYEAKDGSGSLWRINRAGHSQLLLDNLTIPNGLDWWNDDFWFVDGPHEEISCYKWSDSGLQPTSKKFKTAGTPDGFTIDAKGEIWLALWGQGRIDHFNTQGEVVDQVLVDSPHSTSICFAGEELNLAVVTSAQFALTKDQLKKHPRAGGLFSCQLDTEGRPPNLLFR